MAWHVERFAREKRLKPLDRYLKEGSPDKSRGTAALLGALRAMKKKGVPMTITKLKKKRSE